MNNVKPCHHELSLGSRDLAMIWAPIFGNRFHKKYNFYEKKMQLKIGTMPISNSSEIIISIVRD